MNPLIAFFVGIFKGISGRTLGLLVWLKGFGIFRIIAILLIINLFAPAFSQAVKERNPTILLYDMGFKLIAAENELITYIDILKTQDLTGFQRLNQYIRIGGTIILFSYIIRILEWVGRFASNLSQKGILSYGFAFLFIFLLEFAFLGAINTAKVISANPGMNIFVAVFEGMMSRQALPFRGFLAIITNLGFLLSPILKYIPSMDSEPINQTVNVSAEPTSTGFRGAFARMLDLFF